MRRKKVSYVAPRTGYESVRRAGSGAAVARLWNVGSRLGRLRARFGQALDHHRFDAVMFALIAVSIGRFLPMSHARLVMALSDVRFHL
jgi:hypothetical protein